MTMPAWQASVMICAADTLGPCVSSKTQSTTFNHISWEYKLPVIYTNSFVIMIGDSIFIFKVKTNNMNINIIS